MSESDIVLTEECLHLAGIKPVQTEGYSGYIGEINYGRNYRGPSYDTWKLYDPSEDAPDAPEIEWEPPKKSWVRQRFETLFRKLATKAPAWARNWHRGTPQTFDFDQAKVSMSTQDVGTETEYLEIRVRLLGTKDQVGSWSKEEQKSMANLLRAYAMHVLDPNPTFKSEFDVADVKVFMGSASSPKDITIEATLVPVEVG